MWVGLVEVAVWEFHLDLYRRNLKEQLERNVKELHARRVIVTWNDDRTNKHKFWRSSWSKHHDWPATEVRIPLLATGSVSSATGSAFSVVSSVETADFQRFYLYPVCGSTTRNNEGTTRSAGSTLWRG